MVGDWKILIDRFELHDVADYDNLPVSPNPDVCLYSLAMALRGEADGSAHLCLSPGEPVKIRDYLKRRLAVWGGCRSASERHFQLFLEGCIEEAEEMAPWLFAE